MKSYKNILFGVLILAVSIGCSSSTTGPSVEEEQKQEQEDPPKPPTASFTVDGDLFTGGEVVFSNTSENADSYKWKFGDGTTANESNPTKTYSDYKTFTVTLTATNEDGEDSVTKEVTIEPSKVFIKTVKVLDFSFVNGNGASWDNSGNPDLFYFFTDESGTKGSTSSTVNNISPSDLPVTWAYEEPGLELNRTDFETNFIFSLWDEDISEHEIISTVPSDYFTIRDLWIETTPDTVTLESGESKVRLTLGWE